MSESARVKLARKRKAWLLMHLGRTCQLCGKDSAEVKLHFDCIVPQGSHHHRKLGFCCRIRFYLRQHELQNLRVLCESCNSRKGSIDDREYHRMMERMEQEDIGVAHSPTPTIETEEVPF